MLRVCEKTDQSRSYSRYVSRFACGEQYIYIYYELCKIKTFVQVLFAENVNSYVCISPYGVNLHS